MNYLVARVSDREQRKALPAQKKKLYDYAERLRWKDGEDFKYIEFDETAFKENRKDFRALVIEPLKKQKDAAIVVFDKIDRYTRDSSSDEKAALTQMWKAGKIEMHFPSDNLYINRDSPAADLFRLDIGIALAGYYSSAIRDNVKRRFEQMLNDGIWTGKAPIGYTNFQEQQPDGKMLKGIRVDPVRAPHIIKAFELRSTGLPYKEITKMMKARGLVSNTRHRKPITLAQWEKIFKNPFYVGRMLYMGKEYDHKYEPIIEPWLWDKVQDMKLARGLNKTKYASKPYLFKQLKCHTCGYSVTFDGPKRNGKYIYGKCTEYGGKHGAQWVNEEKLYEQVRELLRSIHLPESELPTLVAEVQKNYESEQEYYTSMKTGLQKEYDALDEELEGLFRDRQQFASHHDMFERMVKKIEVRQKEILGEMQDHSDGDKAFVIGASYLIDVCSRAAELFDAKTSKLEQKRYLLSFILSNTTLEGEKLHFTLKEPFEDVINMSKTQNWCGRRESNSHRLLGRQAY